MKKLSLLLSAGALLLIGISCQKKVDPKDDTTAKLATVVTVEASNVLSSSFVAGGNITNDGGASVTERGLCYGTSAGVSVDNVKVPATSAGKGVFEVTVSGLNAGATYYYRAYAVNSAGIAYGSELSATTPSAQPATVTTAEVVDAVGSSATCGGTVTDDGQSFVSARGVCWSKSENPTVSDNKTVDGSGLGEFTSTLTDLEVGVTYYVRAYATNDTGTVYGEQFSFTTIDAKLPTINTFEVTEKTTVGANCGGEITSDGGARITAKGVCWATHKNPTIDDNKTEDGSGTDSFVSAITGLTEGTVYYCRAYAINAVGIAYGNERPFAPWYLDNGESMLLVKGGTFTVGKNAVHTDSGPNTWECTLPDYYIAKTEVTQQLWAEIMGTDYLADQLTDAQKPDGYICYPVGRDDYNPQPYINWFDAIIFCNKLSAARGADPCYSVNGETNPDKWNKSGEWEKSVVCDWGKNGFRLPSLPEWEFAAGGGEEPLQTYPGTNDFSELHWYGQIEGALPGGATEGLFTVATKLPNKLGLYDMVGNATEWVWERWFEYPGGARTYYNDVITWDYGARKAIKRGGSIWNWGQQVYYTTSNWTDPIDDHNWPCGMRLARTCVK